MKELEIFYAVNKSGQGVIFEDEPSRDTMLEVWCGQYNGSVTMVVARMESLGFVLPKITWEDEPVKLKLSLAYEA
mgnify:CR=1 FL=1